MRYAKLSKMSFAEEFLLYGSLCKVFSLGTQRFISVFFVTPVTCTDNLKILNEYVHKAISRCPHFATWKVFSNSGSYNWVSVRNKTSFWQKDRKSFQKQVRRLTRNPSPLPWMSTKIDDTMQDRDQHYRKVIKSNS